MLCAQKVSNRRHSFAFSMKTIANFFCRSTSRAMTQFSEIVGMCCVKPSKSKFSKVKTGRSNLLSLMCGGRRVPMPTCDLERNMTTRYVCIISVSWSPSVVEQSRY
jgi:hypothetical protein